MAKITYLYWRDIPAQIIVKAGRKTAKRQLAERFQEAVDSAAMRAKAIGTDAYLDDWRKSDPITCGDDLEAEADAAVVQIEAEYNDELINKLIAQKGHANG